MSNEIWCIAGGEGGTDRQLADALLRGGNTVAVVGRDVAPYALLVDDYADAIMPVEITATTSEALAEVRESIELNLGQVSHFAVLLGDLGEGTAEEVAERLTGKLERAGRRRDEANADHRAVEQWPADSQLVLVRGPATGASAADREAENAELETRIQVAAAQADQPMLTVRVRELEALIRGASAATIG